jgi:hypothetical protein
MITPTAAHRALTGQIDASAATPGTPTDTAGGPVRRTLFRAASGDCRSSTRDRSGESNRSDTGGSAPPGTTPTDGAQRGLHDRAEADAQVARVASSGLWFHALATWAVSRGVPIVFSGRLLTIR